jgi:hypothetical protein
MRPAKEAAADSQSIIQSERIQPASGHSVNDRVDDTTLTPARFGKVFSRLLYHISYLRRIKTDEPIDMMKDNFKSAYRRIHLQAPTAVKAYTCINGILLVAFRMTFEGSPSNPSLWSDVSEVFTDSANDLVRRSPLAASTTAGVGPSEGQRRRRCPGRGGIRAFPLLCTGLSN